MTPNYIAVINQIAEGLANLPSYEERLLAAWKEYESLANNLMPAPRDVLSIRCSNWQALHDHTERFVKLLYENGDSTSQQDCDQIREKDAAYGGSWHARGGDGAFHALARKGDRIVSMLKKHGSLAECRKDKTNSESIDDTLGDLRRYFILILSWHHEALKIEELIPSKKKSYADVAQPAAEYVQPGQMEDGNDKEPVCAHCGHTRGTHDNDGCNGYMAATGLMCSCTNFAAKVKR